MINKAGTNYKNRNLIYLYNYLANSINQQKLLYVGYISPLI